MGSKHFDCPIAFIYCISNDVKANSRSLSRKFHGEMTLFASTFAEPMKICACLFLFDKPIKCFAFLFTFCTSIRDENAKKKVSLAPVLFLPYGHLGFLLLVWEH